MSKTLTITIRNLPDEMMDEYWKHGIKNAKSETDVPISRTDNIHIDFDHFDRESAHVLNDLLSAAITGHTAFEADKILNG
jgi:hypothetical protein